MFEDEVAHYTGAKYAVATTSCTDSLWIACAYEVVRDKEVTIPKHTYLSVPMSIMHAGAEVVFEDLHWNGTYQHLNIYNIKIMH